MQAFRLRSLVFVALAALASGAVQSQTPQPTLEKIKQTNVFTIAYRESSVPFSYLVDGKPVGYAVELCQRLAATVQKQLKLPKLDIKYVPVTSSSRVEAITSGKADVECGSTTNNAERRKQVAFTVPHYIAGARLLVRVDSGIASLADMRGKTMALTKGTTTVKIIDGANDAQVLKMRYVEGKDHAESFSLVETKRADAFAMDDILLFSLRASAKNPAEFSVVGDLLSVEPLAIMLRANDVDFKKLVDAEMSRVALDGDGAKLYAKWFLSPIPPKGTSLNIPMSRFLRDAWRYPSDQVAD